MFAPEGYVSFKEVLEQAWQNTLFEAAEIYLERYPRSVNRLLTSRRDDIIFSWVLQYFQFDLHVGNLNGRVLKLDGKSIFYHLHFVDMWNIHNTNGNSSTSEICPELRRVFRFCEPVPLHERKRFLFLGVQTEESENPTEINAAMDEMNEIFERHSRSDGMTRVPIFYNAQNGKVDLRLFHELQSKGFFDEYSDSSEKSYISEELAEVEGWYYCVPNSLLANGAWQQHTETIFQREYDTLFEVSTPEHDSLKKDDFIENSLAPHKRILSYIEKHPDKTKADVRINIMPETSVRGFEHYWRRAAEINPNLSKPGPRK